MTRCRGSFLPETEALHRSLYSYKRLVDRGHLKIVVKKSCCIENREISHLFGKGV